MSDDTKERVHAAAQRIIDDLFETSESWAFRIRDGRVYFSREACADCMQVQRLDVTAGVDDIEKLRRDAGRNRSPFDHRCPAWPLLERVRARAAADPPPDPAVEPFAFAERMALAWMDLARELEAEAKKT